MCVGLLTQVSHNDFNVNYEYDNKDRMTKIKIAGTDYANFAYDETEQKTTTTLATGETFENCTNKNGQTTFVNCKSGGDFAPINQFIYDENNYLQTEIDKLTNATTTYEYDYFGNVTKMQNNQHGKENSVINEYFKYSHNTLKNASLIVNETPLNYAYSYKNETKQILSAITLPNTKQQSITYDKLDRVSGISLGNLTKQIKYEKVGDYASNLISVVKYGKLDNGIIKENEKLAYKYDKQGNISEIRQNNNLIARYAYDGLNRLVREDNKIFNKTILFNFFVNFVDFINCVGFMGFYGMFWNDFAFLKKLFLHL